MKQEVRPRLLKLGAGLVMLTALGVVAVLVALAMRDVNVTVVSNAERAELMNKYLPGMPYMDAQGTFRTTDLLVEHFGIFNGRVGIGEASPQVPLDIVTADSTTAMQIRKYFSGTSGAKLLVTKARGTELAPTVVANGDDIFSEFGYGYDGAAFQLSSEIHQDVVDTVGAGIVPGRIQLSTADSSGVLNLGYQLDHQTRSTMQKVCYSPDVQVGQLAAFTRLDNWAPTGIQNHSVINVIASDNTGSLITGISSTNINIGDLIVLCNFNAPTDDGVIALSNLDPNSSASNQIIIPDSGRLSSVNVDRYYIANETCATLVYSQPDSSTLTNHKWALVSTATRTERSITQSLQNFPDFTTSAAATTGTLNDWTPTNACPQIGGPVAGVGCEAGGSTLFDDYSIIRIATADGTGATITGMHWAGNASAAGLGPTKMLINYGPGAVTLTHQGGGSAANNRFFFPTAASVVLPVGGSLFVRHSVQDNFWMPIGTVPYTAGTGISIPTSQVVSLSINGGVTQTATAGQAFTSMTSAGIMSSSVFVNAAGTNLTLTGSSLALAAAPTIAAGNYMTQALQADGPAITPTAITSGAQTDDWNPTNFGSNSFIRTQTSTAAMATLSGMTGPGAGSNPGARKILCNFGPGPYQLLDTSASSAAANRFQLPFSVTTAKPTVSIPFGACDEFSYDSGGGWWPMGIYALSNIVSMGTKPVLSSCGGGSPTNTGTNSAGTVTEGTTTAACTITFANSGWDATAQVDVPTCVISSRTGINPVTINTISRTALVVANTSASGLVFDYICIQTQSP